MRPPGSAVVGESSGVWCEPWVRLGAESSARGRNSIKMRGLGGSLSKHGKYVKHPLANISDYSAIHSHVWVGSQMSAHFMTWSHFRRSHMKKSIVFLPTSSFIVYFS